MIGTRQWISKLQQKIEPSTSKSRGIASENRNASFFQEILIRGKKISQIISFIWLNQDEEVAQKLDEYFKEVKGKKIEDLLFAKNPETEAYKLLLEVFKEEKFLPIFEENDKLYFNFKIVTDKFEGNISDPGPSDDGILTLTIPYPPCPEIYEDVNDTGIMTPVKKYTIIKESELKEWVEQSPEKEPYFYQDNYYIPATSS